MFNNSLWKSMFILAASPFLVSAQPLIIHLRQFYKMPNKSLLGNVIETKQVEDYFDCSFLCLEHGPFDCLSFNFGTVNDNGYYTCELSSSERYLEPQKMEQRSSYDYYGTTAEVSSTHINRGNMRLKSEPIYSLKIQQNVFRWGNPYFSHCHLLELIRVKITDFSPPRRMHVGCHP